MPPRASPPTLPLTPSRVCRGGSDGNHRLCQEVRRQASCFLTQNRVGEWNTSGSWEHRLAPTSRPGPPAGRRGHRCRARRRHRDTSRRQLACPHAAHHGCRRPARERRRATRRRQPGARRADDHLVGALRAGAAGRHRPRRGRRRRRRPRRVPRQERHRALRGVVRRRLLQRRAASTSTGASPRPRSPTSSTTPAPRCSWSAPDFVPVLDAIGDDLAADVTGDRDRRAFRARELRGLVGARTTTSTRTPPPGRSTTSRSSSTRAARPAGPRASCSATTTCFALLPAAVDMWGFSERSVNLVAMPLFHIGGSGWALVGMYVGARSVILRDLDPAALVAPDRLRAGSPTPSSSRPCCSSC